MSSFILILCLSFFSYYIEANRRLFLHLACQTLRAQTMSTTVLLTIHQCYRLQVMSRMSKATLMENMLLMWHVWYTILMTSINLMSSLYAAFGTTGIAGRTHQSLHLAALSISLAPGLGSMLLILAILNFNLQST